ncbi:MAG: xanthine dehydrogenase family protein subunit M [Anaerolineae bacterium]
MRLPKFEHLQPESLEEAFDLLSECGEEARVIAGGTDLLVSMKQRLLTPKYLLNLKGLAELDFIKDGKEGLRIGALTRLTTLIKSPLVREKFPVLAQAASYVSAPPLQNMGTLGGNLCLNTRCFFYNQSQFWRQARPLCFKTGGEMCHVVKGGDHCYSVYQGDMAPVLVALEAKIKLAKKGGGRAIPLLDLYTGKGQEPIALEAGEILTEVEIPAPAASWRGDYQKLRYRGAMDFPLVGVAAVLHRNGEGCARAKVVLTAVTSAPVVVEEASKILEGQRPDDEAIAKAAEAAYEVAHPVANVGSTPLYRRKMVRVMTKRAIGNASRIMNHESWS